VDEIFVNAADNVVRGGTTEIRVTIDEKTGQIRVWNNGQGLRVEFHTKANKWAPEFLFGNMRVSSHYDDSVSRTAVCDLFV
jgi:DNA topoisomerase-2